jgi:glutamyl-tRNA synthetase
LIYIFFFFRAFGWQPPIYAHLPLILNTDGSKLSKRQGDIRVENYRKEGIFPEALLNFIIDAGGGFTKDVARTKSRIYTLQELTQQVSSSGDLVCCEHENTYSNH